MQERMKLLFLIDEIRSGYLWDVRIPGGGGGGVTTKPRKREVQYISILKNGEILVHFNNEAVPFSEYGKTIFRSRKEARRTQED